MKRRLLFIFIVAGIAAAGIIVSQVYWVYFNYRTARGNYITSANHALARSINAYQLQYNALPVSLTDATPSLTFFMKTMPNSDSVVLDKTKIAKPFLAEFMTVLVNDHNVQEVNALLARLLSQQRERPIILDTLHAIFVRELTRENIDQKFRLIARSDSGNVSPDAIAAWIWFKKSPVKIEAVEEGMDWRWQPQNVLPALASLTLIFLSAGSLWYMGTIIRRQMRLDRSKNDFINNVTHELRTPVSILKTSQEALANFGAANDPEKLSRYLKINASVLDTLDQTVDRILEIAQYEEGVKKAQAAAVDLEDVIVQVIQRFSGWEQCTIRLNYALAEREIVTDRHIIATIVSNLIDNAVKYGGGTVIIDVRVVAIRGGWQISVTDNGMGIASEYLPFIFDRFYRVPYDDTHDVKGYGLGLSYVKQLVDLLCGTITVESKLEKGTSFVLEFPL